MTSASEGFESSKSPPTPDPLTTRKKPLNTPIPSRGFHSGASRSGSASRIATMVSPGCALIEKVSLSASGVIAPDTQPLGGRAWGPGAPLLLGSTSAVGAPLKTRT
jgi:hypothetical protein